MRGSSPAHRTSHGGGSRDSELPVSGTVLPSPEVNGTASDAAGGYNPKRKARLHLPSRALAAVRRVGMARIVSGSVSIFLLLSVFSVRPPPQ